jgi:type II secretory pathway component PulF
VDDQLPTALPAISLEELIALNEEMAALVRAGVPLEQGLAGLEGEWRGRLGRISRALGERLQRGQSLSTILQEEPGVFPPVYRAAIEAGMKCGRLGAALEAVASSARRLLEIRRMVAGGVLYPVIVLLLAWGVFVFYAVKLAPQFTAMFRAFQFQSLAVTAAIASLGRYAAYWGRGVPLVLLALLAIWFYSIGRAGILQPSRADWLLAGLPWIAGAFRSFRVATFTDVLSLLVENVVPLPQAMRLAAEAVGDPRLTRFADAWAAGLTRGQPPDSAEAEAAGLFPLLSWIMATGHRQPALASALRRTAEMYYRRGTSQAEAARVFLPVLLTLAVGATATLAVGVLLLGPWYWFLFELAKR